MRSKLSIHCLNPLSQFMAMLSEALLNIKPRLVEIYRSLQVAASFVRMHADDLHPVKLACLLQHMQVIDRAHPKRCVLPQPSDVKHLLRHTQYFQQAHYLSGSSCGFGISTVGKLEQR